MDKIRIQIVNYKTKSYLLDCLASIVTDLKSFDGKYSIAILDNASGDDLSDIPRLFSENNIRIIKSNKNLGFGGGTQFFSCSRECSLSSFAKP